MAYQTKYFFEFQDRIGNNYQVRIQKDGTFTPTRLEPGQPPCVISYKGDRDKFSPLMPSECELNITVLPSQDKYFPREFVGFIEKEYRVQVINLSESTQSQTALIWTGFLIPDRYQEDLVPAPFNVKLRALDGIGLLNDRFWEVCKRDDLFKQGTRPDQLPTPTVSQFRSLASIIIGTMRAHTPVDQIVDWLDIYEDGFDDTVSVLTQTYVDTAGLFEKGDEDDPGKPKPRYANEVIEELLKPFGARMYQSSYRQDGILFTSWIIERVNAIHAQRAGFDYAILPNSAQKIPTTGTNVTLDPYVPHNSTWQPFYINEIRNSSTVSGNPRDEILMTQEDTPSVEFKAARPDARVTFKKEYRKGIFSLYGNGSVGTFKGGVEKRLEGFIFDPFFAFLTGGTQPFFRVWQTFNNPTLLSSIGQGITGGNNNTVIIKQDSSGESGVYSTGLSGDSQSDGNTILVNGRTIEFKFKALTTYDEQDFQTKKSNSNVSGKIALINGQTSGGTISTSYSIKVIANGKTFYGAFNTSKGVVDFNQTTSKQNISVNFDGIDQWREGTVDVELPDEGVQGEILIFLNDPSGVEIYLTKGPSKALFPFTKAAWAYAQLVDKKDEVNSLAEYDGLSNIKTTAGRYDNEITFADAPIAVSNAFARFPFLTDDTKTKTLSDLTQTTSWKPGNFTNQAESKTIAKQLARQYIRNLKTESMILECELWRGRVNDHPFHFFYEEDHNGTIISRTMLAHELQIDLANSRLSGQWIENLQEQEGESYTGPSDSVPIEEPPDLGVETIRQDKQQTFSPVSLGGERSQTITTGGQVLHPFAFNIDFDFTQISSTIDLFLPNINDVEEDSIFTFRTLKSSGTGSVDIKTNPNDNAEFSEGSTFEFVPGDSLKVKSNGSDWLTVA
jgi:hypothetical protein